MKAIFAASFVALMGLGGLSGCVVIPADPGSAAATASGNAMGAALNAARAENGLGSLQPSAELMAAAREQAQYMADTSQVTHTGSGGSSVGQRARSKGCSSYSWVAENVAMGQTSDAETMAMWMTSEGHRRNALNAKARIYGSAKVGSYRALVLASGC